MRHASISMIDDWTRGLAAALAALAIAFSATALHAATLVSVFPFLATACHLGATAWQADARQRGCHASIGAAAPAHLLATILCIAALVHPERSLAGTALVGAVGTSSLVATALSIAIDFDAHLARRRA